MLLLVAAADPSPGAFVLAGVVIVMAILLFFLPTFIAAKRSHPNVAPIFVINLLLGPVFGIGWVAALAWSVSAIK